MARRKSLSFVVGGVVASLVVVGLAGISGAAPQTGRRCGAPWEAPGFEVPARQHVVPDVVCMNLQLAQDKMQAAYFDRVRSRDGAGQGRNQFDDRNWVVIAQDPSAGTRGQPNDRVMLTALRYGDPGAPPVPNWSQPGRVPRLRCFDLQEAQDTLEAAGFLDVSSEDASGNGRNQIVDRNWTVVGQRPSPGSTVAKRTEIVLEALKDDDPSSCPQ